MLDDVQEIDSQKIAIKIYIPLKGMSVNKAWRSFRGRTIKSKEYRDYEIAFNHFMAANFEQCAMFMDNLDMHNYAVKVHIDFYFQWQDIMTKDNRFKLRGTDVDNCIKTCMDGVFKFLNVDDGIVSEVSAKKIPSHANWTVVTLERVDLPKQQEIPDLPKWSEVDH